MKELIAIPVIFGGALAGAVAGTFLIGGYGFLLGFTLSAFFDEV